MDFYSLVVVVERGAAVLEIRLLGLSFPTIDVLVLTIAFVCRFC